MIESINKYLEGHGEREISLLAGFPVYWQFDQSIVVPACNESTDFFSRLKTSILAPDTLLIVVINQPDNNSDIARNHQFFRRIQAAGHTLWKNQNISLIRSDALHVLVVDRYTDKKIPEKEGVGRARKIGCDIAVELYRRKQIRHPIIYSTDADAHLPANYFDREQALDNETSALVFEFEHLTDDTPLGRATRAYEQAIKYYKTGLEWAGSPYGFYTLGSTLAINMLHYCQVRGFPKRAGGEDFYLLNKLAKTGAVRTVPEIVIRIDSRLSDRVPFGTGPAVKKIMDSWENGEDYLYYHPDNFVKLKTWLDLQPALAEAILANSNNPLQIVTDETLLNAARTMEFSAFVEHAKKQCASTSSYQQHFHHWFDGFRTLKFIHFMQANYFPAIRLKECLAAGATLLRKSG